MWYLLGREEVPIAFDGYIVLTKDEEFSEVAHSNIDGYMCVGSILLWRSSWLQM